MPTNESWVQVYEMIDMRRHLKYEPRIYLAHFHRHLKVKEVHLSPKLCRNQKGAVMQEKRMHTGGGDNGFYRRGTMTSETIGMTGGRGRRRGLVIWHEGR
jgi:hypothetical protein